MKRKIVWKLILVAALSAMMLMGMGTTFASDLTAKPTPSNILVDGKSVVFDAYNIEGSNYFKLRDLAYALNGTDKQFEVSWDSANNAISLGSLKPYTAIGGEMAGKGEGDKAAIPTSSKIYLDGMEYRFTAFNIEGNNYFKLREIGTMLNIGVEWSGEDNTVSIDTGKDYVPQFDYPFVSYKDEQIGFSIDLPIGEVFGVEEYTVEVDGQDLPGIVVYHKPSRDEGYSGEMFTIIRWNGVWTDENRPIQAGGHAILAQYDNYTLILHTPSGVEFNPYKPLAYEQSRWMYKQHGRIIDSVKLIN